MNYELAKELKDAGYEMDYELDNFSEYDKRKANIHLDLAELIEACGNNFNDLSHSGSTGNKWYARSGLSIIVSGKTPEEAVARLWLALNKK